MKWLINYLLNIIIALDNLGNTFLGGYPDETISSRAWRCRNSSKLWGKARIVIDKVFFWERDHCYQSYLSEQQRKHLPPNF